VLTISQWADQYRKLSPESAAEPGQWNTDRAPYQREIMDAITAPDVEGVVLMTSAQIGKTAVLENVLGYYVSQDPAPILVLMPTLEMAHTFSKDRLATMLRDTPILSGLVKDPRARDSGNTMLHKTFPGGHITITGANSPSSLASRPIRIVLCDEVDRYPASAGSEGDPVHLARKRTATFWNRKLILTSTPTVKDLSRIEAAFLQSDQRRYHVPCPHCGERQVLKWANVKWDEGKPQTAAYYCEHCGAAIDEADKPKMLLAGKWTAEAPFNGVAGFHLNELYSPWRKWGEVAADFLEAKHGGTEMLKAWVNTSLGEVWQEQGDSIEPTGLLARLEQYEREGVPIVATTMGADVQKDRIEISVVGWGKGEEGWLLDHVILPGDTARPEVWSDLSDLVDEIKPSAMAVDSGYNSDQVYAFCGRRRFAFATKGTSGFNRPLIEDARRRAQRLRRAGRRGLRVEPLGVDSGKVTIYSRLRQTEPGPGYIHFPDDHAFDDEYFAQLTAERLVVKYRFGRPSQEWVQLRPRNEALDCLVYALAALRLVNLDLDHLAQKRAEPDTHAAGLKRSATGLPKGIGAAVGRRGVF
jgi:phage terminase large subunit GpA-like protein